VVRGWVKQVDSSSFLVGSESNPGTFYRVSWSGKKWVCDCPDYRKTRRCKHVYAVCWWVAVKGLASALKSELDDSKPKCPRCGSNNHVIGYGHRYCKHGPSKRFKCKRCGVTFTSRSGFEGLKSQAYIVALALDLYFRGMSLRKVSEHLEIYHKTKVSYTTIYSWIRKFTEIVYNYLKDLPLPAGFRCCSDSTVLRLKDRHVILWGLLDHETRMLIAEHVSRRKASEEALNLLKKGINSNGEGPMEVVTDGASEFSEAMDKLSESAGKPIVHIQSSLKTGLNNRMERFFGTLKERAKLALHFNSEEGINTFTKGFLIHYNCSRGHLGLKGKTPYQATNLTQAKLSWLDLVKMAKDHKASTENLQPSSPSEQTLKTPPTSQPHSSPNPSPYPSKPDYLVEPFFQVEPFQTWPQLAFSSPTPYLALKSCSESFSALQPTSRCPRT